MWVTSSPVDAKAQDKKFAQELLSTFSTSLGEVSLIPSTGGTFVVNIYHKDATAETGVRSTTLWDRKAEGGFPETKVCLARLLSASYPDSSTAAQTASERCD